MLTGLSALMPNVNASSFLDLGLLETLKIDDPKRVGWAAAFRIFAEFESRYLAEVFKKKPKPVCRTRSS